MKRLSKPLGAAAAVLATTAMAQTPAPALSPGPQPPAFAVCAACHEVDPGAAGVGPNLAGVVGRRAGSGDFDYSPAMKASGLTWTPDQLRAFIADPGKVVPGNRMDFDGAPDADAKAIVDYLATLKS